jgi:23S rRNA (cytidine1920-2'-O)/16S rRNA (cytidine1409-2'-O)-methyltransferase
MLERLDKRIMERGLAQSRERAQMLIGAGLVTVNGRIAEKPSERVEEEVEILVTGEAMPYVGRGGLKLEAALKHFRVNVKDSLCLDVGASTGGFTDCLLQRGARRIVAIEVGHGQLAESIANDPRVELREGVNARYLSPEQFPDPFDIAVIDVSFISLTLVLPAVAPLLRPGGHIVALVKPEFEAGREAVGPRGIVRSPEARKAALQKVIRFGADELKLEPRGTVPSPDLGGGGNRETFVYFRVLPPSGTTEAAPAASDGSDIAGNDSQGSTAD